MILIENTEVLGWEHAVHGMRNPMNSWEKSDSYSKNGDYIVGPNDLDLMRRLAANGPVHAKYRRMITVYADILAPLYWWKEFDTYKVGTVVNSCSTMHKVHTKEFTIDDFSREHLFDFMPDLSDDILDSADLLEILVKLLNYCRQEFLNSKDKEWWWQIIQLLPSSYNQRRTVMMNYEVLANIYPSRKNHKLDEWCYFRRWIEGLPLSELITTGTDA